MKRQTIIPIVSCLLILGIVGGCKSKFDEKKYLTKILNNLEQVKSASYTFSMVWSDPGDTIPSPYNPPYIYHYKEFANPADTAAGVSWGDFYLTDTTKMSRSYNGNVAIVVNHSRKTISIDSSFFGGAKVFFKSAQNIIKYALTTNDSILKEFLDFGDSLLFSLTIYSDKMVMLDNIRPSYTSPSDEIKITKYELLINKSTGLPYKRKTIFPIPMSRIYWEEVSDAQINTMDIEDFIPSRYFPADYDITIRGAIVASPLDLLGKPAPDWILSDYNNKSFALKDFTSKVILLQFSGIGCSPCHASLPFLKQLENDYKDKSFEIVRIECWSKNVDQIKNYISTNDIKYKFLLKDVEIEKKYNMPPAPTFLILDGNRTIQYVQRGYGRVVDEQIKEAIEKLL